MASGDSLVYFNPQMAQFPSSNYATFDTRNTVLVLDFDDTTDETCYFRGLMPRHYDGGGVTVSVRWAATSATTGTISLDVAFAKVGDDTDDIDGSLFASAKNANPTTASASGEVDYVDIAFSSAEADSVAAGEEFFLLVRRDADGTTSTDNLTGDMELLGIEIRET